MKLSAVYVLGQLYPINIDIAFRIKLKFNFTSHLRLCLPNCLFPSSFMNKTPYTLFRPLHITCSTLISSSTVGNPNHILRRLYNMCYETHYYYISSSILYSLVTSQVLFQISSSAICFQSPEICSSCRVKKLNAKKRPQNFLLIFQSLRY